MFASILVPFDGSHGAEAALAKAAALACLCGAELTLLTVYRHHSPLEASMHVVRPDEPADLDDIMRTHAREVAEHGKARAAAYGVPAPRAFVKGGPVARTIAGFAKEHGHDLTVIGSRGLGSFERALLGSVSHKVTSLSETPVLVV
ncbi:universal stress protein [Ruegeria pomeroyi]|uniref:Universal stress protein family protein n=2 Tax=Ruegeria pomeroyi TaxID=89184 RepID=Q5LUB0_RUEPO|nr:universal stress protein [Ruegeria pomeroyi]HCE70781.1 universal stress protein [Ruegeria sp.]AAV94444.1 universal stress protein family protein [Ruegeria pomeroyi DSS-3]NVK99446.1 universal stress protein [Ruegeria pomeroyi]NVL03310.1 universal stress protein [Ruegeria pomeroyi]QWV08026.1 universal stress protein [Ruegeria pomeroyi]